MCAPNGGWVEAARAVVLFMGGQALSAKAWFDHVKSRIALFDALASVRCVCEIDARLMFRRLVVFGGGSWGWVVVWGRRCRVGWRRDGRRCP